MNVLSLKLTSRRLQKLIPAIIFLFGVFLYRDCFLKEYFMQDELGKLGNPSGVTQAIKHYFGSAGRPLLGATMSIGYYFAGVNPLKITLIRFVNFLGMIGMALLLFSFFKRNTRSTFFSASLAVIFIAQPNFQGLMVYGLQAIAANQAAWFSLIAFFCFFGFAGRKKTTIARTLWTALFLLMAFLSHQALAFFCIVPLSFLLLAGEDVDHGKVTSYLILVVACFVLAGLLFLANAWNVDGKTLHHRGDLLITSMREHPLEMLTRGMLPIKYYSAFELWTYPFILKPVKFTPDLKKNIAYAFLFIWSCLWIFSLAREFTLSKKRSDVCKKHLFFLVCLALGALPLLMDAPLKTIRHRPQINFVLSNIILLSAFCLLRNLYPGKNERLKTFVKGSVIIVIGIYVQGALSAVQHNFVGLKNQELMYVGERLQSKKNSEYDRIVVVYPRTNFCPIEPCDYWCGSIVQAGSKIYPQKNERRGIYRYMLKKQGIRIETKKMLYFTERPAVLKERDLLIDWNEYVKRQRDYFAKT